MPPVRSGVVAKVTAPFGVDLFTAPIRKLRGRDGKVTNFRIADTFTDSLARLTGDEQKVAKTTAFDLQLNPVNPGMQLHKIEKSKDVTTHPFNPSSLDNIAF